MTSDKRIHIVHVIHHLVIGGMENGLVNLINRMPKERFRHTVICIEDYSEFRDRIQIEDARVIALYRSKIGIWPLRYKLFKLFRTLRPDIVHSRNMSGLDAILPARFAGVKCRIHGEHGRDVDDLHGTDYKYKLLRRLHSPFISHYITVSNELKQYLIKDIKVSAHRVTQIINGVDVDKFTTVETSKSARSRLVHAPDYVTGEDKIIIGTVGRLQKVKNHTLLIKSFARLLEKEHLQGSISLVVVGDGPEKENLMSLAEDQGIAGKIWFAGSSSKVPECLQLMDIFVLSSFAEGISNTILEAMATGLPVVATAVGGNVELVRDGETGFLVESDNVKSMTCALERICENSALHKDLSRAARQTAISEFSLNSMVSRYQRIYEDQLRSQS